jgi:hypothetical protein
MNCVKPLQQVLQRFFERSNEPCSRTDIAAFESLPLQKDP